MLSPQLLELLRLWWREGKRGSVLLPHGWLFPGRSYTDPIYSRQLHRAVHEAAEAGYRPVFLGRPAVTSRGHNKPARTSTFDGIPRRAAALTRALPSTVTWYGASRLTRRTMLGGSCSIPRRRLRTRRTAPSSSVSSRRDTSRCAGTCIRGGRAWRSCSRPGCARWCMDTRGTSRRCHDPRGIDMDL